MKPIINNPALFHEERSSDHFYFFEKGWLSYQVDYGSGFLTYKYIVETPNEKMQPMDGLEIHIPTYVSNIRKALYKAVHEKIGLKRMERKNEITDLYVTMRHFSLPTYEDCLYEIAYLGLFLISRHQVRELQTVTNIFRKIFKDNLFVVPRVEQIIFLKDLGSMLEKNTFSAFKTQNNYNIFRIILAEAEGQVDDSIEFSTRECSELCISAEKYTSRYISIKYDGYRKTTTEGLLEDFVWT